MTQTRNSSRKITAGSVQVNGVTIAAVQITYSPELVVVLVGEDVAAPGIAATFIPA